jgi:3-deoxy-manno-octulosonate cytidylyltransferase (CMP-KDO synthetase)
MKKIAVIPARYAATRFPAKLMQILGNKTVIRHTYDNTVATALFDDVIVATDSKMIFNEIVSNGGKAVMSRKEHESGSDRIAEAIEDLDIDVIINVQGDEPFLEKEPLARLLDSFNDTEVHIASLMHPIQENEVNNPNIVKVITDKAGNALYFSRSCIPYKRDPAASFTYHRHIGVYGYRKKALLDFVGWEIGRLEQVEKLEQLRYLENGVKIRMITTAFSAIGIDTPEDLENARKLL